MGEQVKEPDKLALDMIQCKKDGYGCHYGAWKATQMPDATTRKIPEGWRICKGCGKSYKPKANNQRYCEAFCQKKAARAKYEKRKSEQERGAQYGEN